MRFGGSWASTAIVVAAAMMVPSAAFADEGAPKAKAPDTQGTGGREAPVAIESPPSRPPPLPDLTPEPPPWKPYGDFSAGFAFVERLSGGESPRHPPLARLRPGPGFFLQIGWSLSRYLHLTGYLVESAQALVFSPGALGVHGTIVSPSMHSYVFGARVSPTLPVGPHVRLWLTAGAGWGHHQYPRMTATEAGHDPFMIPARSAAVVEVPMGVGAAFELIPRWLALHVELTGAYIPSQAGTAVDPGGYAVESGLRREIGAVTHLEVSFAQTIGLTLFL